MKNRFSWMFSLFCTITLLICAVSAWAIAESPVATPTDLTIEEEGPAAGLEIVVNKTLRINESWEGKMKKTKPAILKLDLDKAQIVYMLVEGADVWATVEKADRITEDPPRYLTNSETEQLVYSWEAEAGSYLINLGPVEPNLLAMAKVTFMDAKAFETWEAKQAETELETETEPEQEPEAEPENMDEGDKTPVNILTLLPDDRSISYEVLWDVDDPVFGDTAHFVATLNGYDKVDYSIQWQCSEDDINWNDIYGATEETMDVIASEENYLYYWRLMVYVYQPQE